MRINNINNQTNINSKARFNIITDKVLLSESSVTKLTEKAKDIGNSSDMILIGLAEVQERKPFKLFSVFGKTFCRTDNCTKITGACHTFFDIEKPKSFIQDLAVIYGNKKERAKKCYEFVDNYLNQIKNGLINEK